MPSPGARTASSERVTAACAAARQASAILGFLRTLRLPVRQGVAVEGDATHRPGVRLVRGLGRLVDRGHAQPTISSSNGSAAL